MLKCVQCSNKTKWIQVIAYGKPSTFYAREFARRGFDVTRKEDWCEPVAVGIRKPKRGIYCAECQTQVDAEEAEEWWDRSRNHHQSRSLRGGHLLPVSPYLFSSPVEIYLICLLLCFLRPLRVALH